MTIGTKGLISIISSNNITISGTDADHSGLSFATNAILPAVVSATNSGVVDLGATSERFKVVYGIYGDFSQSSTTAPVLKLSDTGVADYDFTFPDTGTIQLGVNTSSNKTLKLINAGSGLFGLEVNGATTITGEITNQGNITVKSDGSNGNKFVRIWNEGTAANDDALISWQTQGSRTYSMGINRSAGNLVITNADNSVASGDLINIDNSGFVGIGQPVPQNLLHLKSNDPKVYLEDGNAGTNEKVYVIYPAGSQYVLQTQTDAYGAGQQIYVVDRSGTTVETQKWYSNNLESLKIDTTSEVQSKRARSNTTGQVGLGIQPSDTTAHYGWRIDQVNNTLNLDYVNTPLNIMSYTASGNVKIGSATTATPAANADDFVIDKGAVESGMSIISTTAASIRFGDAADTSIGSIEYNHTSNYMRFIVNSAEQMKISDNLITFPSAGVNELRGDIGSNKFAIGNMGDASSQMMVSSRGFLTFNVSNTGSAKDATTRMQINASGKVGINETNDARTQLEVKATTSSRNTVTRVLTLNANGDSIQPYEPFGTGIIFEGFDYAGGGGTSTSRDYAYLDARIETSGSTP